MNKNVYLYSLKISAICIMLALCIFFLAEFGGCFDHMSKESIHPVLRSVPVDVVIDAGHGGIDGGAMSKTGILEKDLNLELSLTLRDLCAFWGYNPVMTRTEDALVCDERDPALKGKIKMTDLNNRLKIAEVNQDALFISIHMNKFPIEKYKGLQVYYSDNNDKSSVLANEIEVKVRKYIQQENKRKSKVAGSDIYLLDRISIPAVLVECGFLSNDEDTAKLSSEEYRAKLALIISESIFCINNNN